MDLVEPDGRDFAPDSALVTAVGCNENLIKVNFAFRALRAFDSSSAVYCAPALLFFQMFSFTSREAALKLILLKTSRKVGWI